MNFSKVFNKIADPESRKGRIYGPDTPALYRELNNFEKENNGVLSIIHLNIHSLPPLPDGLISLRCNYNHKLTSLPPLPDTLEELDCDNNPLTSLPQLPDRIQYLSCKQNQLTSLPPLPDTLERLNCAGNQLTSLPSLPDELRDLDCKNNQLTSLPPLPKGLGFGYLKCGGNQLTSLPPLPGFLFNLECEQNKLTSLPRLPGLLQHLSCHDNFNLMNITGECPSSLRKKLASEVFKGCPNLVPQPNPGETLCTFFYRAAELKNCASIAENDNKSPADKLFNKIIARRYIVNSRVKLSDEEINNMIAKRSKQNANERALRKEVNNIVARSKNRSLAIQKAYMLNTNFSNQNDNRSAIDKLLAKRKRLNRGVGSRNLTKLSIGGKTRRNKKRKAKKTRKI